LELPSRKIEIEESKAIALYRIIQEVLNNSLKYSEASNIWLILSENNGTLNIKISDDGKGFDTDQIASSKGIGWQNIYSRIEIINGSIHIESNLTHGTSVEMKLAV